MTEPVNVVFDCNVFFQALTSPLGTAARLLELAARRDIQLFVSFYVLDEIRSVTSRPHIVAKYGLEPSVVAEFIIGIKSYATCLDSVPHVFDFPRDPDDAHYVDLAVAVAAKLIVSRDCDLLALTNPATEEGRDFLMRFPSLEILTPPEALRRLYMTRD